jgi:hypothetical protein
MGPNQASSVDLPTWYLFSLLVTRNYLTEITVWERVLAWYEIHLSSQRFYVFKK